MPGLRVAMAVYGDIRYDSRVLREAGSLAAAGHDVTLFCLADTRADALSLDSRVMVVVVPARGTATPGAGSPFRQTAPSGRIARTIRRAMWLRAYVQAMRGWGRDVANVAGSVDVWHVHDFTGLVAIGPHTSTGETLVYDIHDLFVETGSGRLLPSPARRLVKWYERRLVRRVDLAIAVNRPLADIVASRSMPRRMIVVHNCVPRWVPPRPRPNLIRDAAGIPADRPIVLYHGLLAMSRGIEQLFEAILQPGLETVHLALLGYGELAEPLRRLSAESRFEGRVHVLDAVAPSELLSWVASADIGSLAMPNASLNLWLSTPNKLFECLAAGVPVVVSDFPAVRSIVMDDPAGPLGVTCDPGNVNDVARAIRELLGHDPAERETLRNRCNDAARERWNWEAEVAGLVAAYNALPAAPRR